MSFKKIENLMYPHFKYGSSNSLDTDVIIQLTSDEMPDTIEERRCFLSDLLKTHELNWNATLAVFENGVMIDTIYPKAWVDSLNNAFLQTFNNHLFYFEVPVNRMLDRNKTLAIYKTFRSVLTFLSRTKYRLAVKKALKWACPIQEKINILRDIDFSTFTQFNKPNDTDIDIWKTFAFYIAQNVDLIQNNVEIYSKIKCLERYPELAVFINRCELSLSDKVALNVFKNEWLDEVMKFGEFQIEAHYLRCNDEFINMKKEIF